MKEEQTLNGVRLSLFLSIDVYTHGSWSSSGICWLAGWPRRQASVASLAVLGRPQLVHLLNALLELEILALFVRVALVLYRRQRPHTPRWATGSGGLPRTSTADSTRCAGSGSAG